MIYSAYRHLRQFSVGLVLGARRYTNPAYQHHSLPLCTRSCQTSSIQDHISFACLSVKKGNKWVYSMFKEFYVISSSSHYTLSHLANGRDVSEYSGGRRLSSRAQLVCFLTRSKRNTEIDAISDVTVVLGMRQCIE